MPRDGSGIFSNLPGTQATPNNTIESSKYNAFIADIAADLNVARPVTAGGTGQANLTLPDNLFGIKDDVDATKIARFDASGFTPATTRTFSMPDQSGTIALVGDAPVGQCRLVKSGANIVLQPYNGDKIRIAGKLYPIPAAGVSLAPTALATGSDLNVYVLQTAGVLSLEAVVTAHAQDTAAGNVGVEIKSADNTRSLVGKVRCIAGPAFVDTAQQRFVRSWFYRQGNQKTLQNSFTTTRSTASTSNVEINTEIRCEFLAWADEVVDCALSIYASNSSNTDTFTVLSLDALANQVAIASSGVAAVGVPHAAVANLSLTEGYHYLSVYGRVTSGTGTWAGSLSSLKGTLI